MPVTRLTDQGRESSATDARSLLPPSSHCSDTRFLRMTRHAILVACLSSLIAALLLFATCFGESL